MSVNPAKGFYKCFGCGKSGTVFNFVMEMERVPFPEAIKIVAQKSNVALPRTAPTDEKKEAEDKKIRDEQKKLANDVIRLNNFALEFWENHLRENNGEAKTAREYFEKRGLSADTIKTFRLGYAPDRWDALLSHLKSHGADEKLIEISGLVSKNEEKARIYDRFRGRVMFPVLDVNGKPVAFGARILADGEPKYLNSPETPAYTKGKNLYGLFQNLEEIKKRKFVILVEGYLDLITPFQHGIRNCVASLGTALTAQQAKLLGRTTRQILINYDGDKAGISAARRAIEVLLPSDFDIKVLILPNGADPDDFLRENGADAYEGFRAASSKTFFNFLLDGAVKDRNLNNPKEKSEAIEDVLPALKAVKNPIQQRESFDAAMNFLRIEDVTSKRELWRMVKVGAKDADISDEAVEKIVQKSTAKPTVAETQLLELILHDAELRAHILPQLEPTDYEPLASAAIFQGLLGIEVSGANLSLETLLPLVGDDEDAADLLSQVWMSEPQRGEGEVIDEVLLQAEKCVATLRSMAIERRMRELTQEISLAQENNDDQLLYQLVQEQLAIARLKIELGRLIA